MGEYEKRASAIGACVYASLFLAYGVYAFAKGVSAPVWLLIEALVAWVIAYVGMWRLSNGASLAQTVLLVSLVHVGVRLAPAVLPTWGDPHAPQFVVPLVLAGGLILTSCWFLLSLLIARVISKEK